MTNSKRGNAEQFSSDNLTDGNKETYWATDDDIRSASIEIILEKKELIRYVVLQEYIKLGQRIKSFTIDVWKDNDWLVVSNGTTVGHKRILKIEPAETSKLRITISDSKACPVLSNVSLY